MIKNKYINYKQKIKILLIEQIKYYEIKKIYQIKKQRYEENPYDADVETNDI